MRKLSQSGFSLIELMIVVAIIGILASVAIPNYQSFQRKSRQAEARSMLGAYYAATSASSAEFNGHLGNFVAIGFQPSGQLTYRVTAIQNANVAYAINAAPANTLTNFNNSPSVAACVVTTALAAGCGNRPGYGNGALNAWTERAVGPVAPGACVPANNSGTFAAAAGSTFTTCASANLGTATADTWSIDQAKVVLNTSSGI